MEDAFGMGTGKDGDDIIADYGFCFLREVFFCLILLKKSPPNHTQKRIMYMQGMGIYWEKNRNEDEFHALLT